MDRRRFLALGGTGVAAGLISATPAAIPSAQAQARGSADQLNTALRRFRALPGDTSYLIEVGQPGPAWRSAYRPNVPMFVGSALKSFILAKFLQDVEAKTLNEDMLLPVNNSIRSISSTVFGQLSGRTSARAALEAMITHSDNTATDMVTLQVGIDRVRDLIAKVGLTQTRIPDSTRILFSYLAGAPYGVDAGWAGMKKVEKDELLGPRAREAINPRVTMVSTSSELVSWYQRALTGEFFKKPKETLVEFKRIQAMAGALALVMPQDTVSYGKGGSIDNIDFHALCLPGQMILGEVPVTFCFTLNWRGPNEGIGGIKEVTDDYLAVLKDAMAGLKNLFG